MVPSKMRVCLLLLSALMLTCLCLGCAPMAESNGIQIITTSFPAYDFARALTKDCEDVEVRMLLSPGTESHSYDPSASDMMAIHDASLLIYIGHGSDLWAERMIESAGSDLETFALTDGLKLLCVEENEHDHSGDHVHHGAEIDSHVWTSPVNAIAIVQRLADKLCGLSQMSSDNCALVESAEAAYIAELTALDENFRSLFEGLSQDKKLLIFGDRFPFRYFAHEYGLSYIAAFPGCSEESEPSAATVATMIETVRSKNIATVFYVEFSAHKIADTIAAETGASTSLLHSCHNVTKEEFNRGETYLSLMRGNLERLREALW